MPQRRRLTPTTVIACLALFFAVAGGSAIALNGRNTVDSGDIKKGQVKTSDIANNAVTTKKIRDNGVRTGDVQNGQIRAADLAPSEPYHVVGSANEPQFNLGGEVDCLWASADTVAPAFGKTAFYKDNLGVVHLRGTVIARDVPSNGDGACTPTGGADPEGVEDARIFTLPAGYAPAQLEAFSAANIVDTELVIVGPVGGATIGTQTIPEGTVMVNFGGEETLALSGITWRAATPGDGLGRRAPVQSGGGAAPDRGVLPFG